MKTILLADDDPLLTDIYTKKLQLAGFEVGVAQSGDEIIKKLREEKFDLLLLDIVLPELSGWDILSKIREDEKLKELKIIIISNLGQKSDIEKGMKMGAVKYLVKAHYTPSQVVKEIQKILGEENK